MPRHIDPELEGRVLHAARKLWHKGGEKALSMRAVAQAAGTNTPAVYRRFRNREDILGALVRSYQNELFEALTRCRSLPEIVQSYLDFALAKPREYELIMSGLLARKSKTRPNVDFVADRISEWLGGSPDDHRALVFTLASLAHGTAMLKITGTIPEEDFPRVRAVFTAAVNVLVENEEKLRSRTRGAKHS
jgi:AcrR family transcriptional regulator